MSIQLSLTGTLHRCSWCGNFFPGREDASTCSDSCRAKKWRWRKRLTKLNGQITALLAEVGNYLEFEESRPAAIECYERARSTMSQEALKRGIRLVAVK